MTAKKLPLVRLQFLIPLGAGIVTVAILTTLLWMQRPVTPADLLPAQNVVAYWHNVEAADFAPYAPWFPDTASMPLPPHVFDAAVLQIHDRREWIVFPALEDVPPDMTMERMRGVPYLASSDAVDQLLGMESGGLSASDAYRELTRGTAPGAPATYLNLPLIGLGSDSPGSAMELAVMRNTQYALIARREDGASLRVSPASIPVVGGYPLPVHMLMPPAALSLSTLNAASFLRERLQSLSPTDRLLLESRLQAAVERSLGKDVSWQYDVAPLLESPSVLSWTRASGSGAEAFQVEGSWEPATLAARMDRFHQSIRASLAGASVTRKNFDGTVVSQAVHDPSLIEDHEEDMDGWSVHITSLRGSDQGLATAVSGRRFIVSTRPSWLIERLSNPSPISMPLSNGLTAAQGTLSDASLKDTLAHPLLRLFASATSTRFSWSVSQDGQTVEMAWSAL